MSIDFQPGEQGDPGEGSVSVVTGMDGGGGWGKWEVRKCQHQGAVTDSA